MLQSNELPTAGVAELADAQDLGFCAPPLLKPAHRYSAKHKVYQRSESRIFKLALLCSLLLIVWLQISESVALAQGRKVFVIPFHVSRDLVLLDVTLDGKPSVLMLDTGAQDSFRTKGDWPIVFHEHDGALTFHTRKNPGDRLSINYTEPDVRLDGILGEDLLRGFRSLKIDYKAKTVTLESL